MGKTVWTSKTVWANIITLIAGTVGYVAGHELIADQATLMSILLAVSGGLNIVLRLITSQPIK